MTIAQPATRLGVDSQGIYHWIREQPDDLQRPKKNRHKSTKTGEPMTIKDYAGMNTKTMIKFWFERLGTTEAVDDFKILVDCLDKNISISDKTIDGNGFWVSLTNPKKWKYSLKLFFCTLDNKIDCCRLRY